MKGCWFLEWTCFSYSFRPPSSSCFILMLCRHLSTKCHFWIIKGTWSLLEASKASWCLAFESPSLIPLVNCLSLLLLLFCVLFMTKFCFAVSLSRLEWNLLGGPKLSLNSRSSCVCLPSARVTDKHHHPMLHRYLVLIQGLWTAKLIL